MEPEEYESIFRLEESHWWYQGMREVAEAWLTRYLPRQRELKVLDAGCGTGGMMVALARFGEVHGLDYSPLALGFCRRRGLSRPVRGSVTEIPFASEQFDLATSFEVLYHAGVADDVGAMKEVGRVLRPGGLFLLRLPAFEFLRGAHDRTVHTQRRYTAGEVRNKLRLAGFRVLRVSYANTFLFPIAAVSRLADRFTRRAQQGGSDVQETSPWVNRVLRAPLSLEARLLPAVDLPVGLSVLALAQRPDGRLPG